MDFMKLLKSLDELLYELVSWLIFYPLTLWRSIRYPKAMMRYADLELSDEPAEQYTETLSPPLFLLLSLLIAHGAELVWHHSGTEWVRPSLLQSDANLLMFRAVLFSIFPLLMSVQLLRHRKASLNRNTLRAPFYSQCYVAAPFALAVSFAGQIMLIETAVAFLGALLLFVSAIAWYLTIETRWFKADLGLSTGRALLTVLATFLAGVTIMVIMLVFIAFGLKT